MQEAATITATTDPVTGGFPASDWASRLTSRACSYCKQVKPYSEFRTHRKGPASKYPGRVERSTTCKQCQTIRGALWNKKHPERRRAFANKHARHNRLQRYGLREAQYNELLAQQGGVCAICKRPPGRRCLGVDHDHDTGAVRGLLCGPCNRALGYFQDSPTVLHEATNYLRKHGKTADD